MLKDVKLIAYSKSFFPLFMDWKKKLNGDGGSSKKKKTNRVLLSCVLGHDTMCGMTPRKLPQRESQPLVRTVNREVFYGDVVV